MVDAMACMSHSNPKQSALTTAARAQANLLNCPTACRQTQFKKQNNKFKPKNKIENKNPRL